MLTLLLTLILAALGAGFGFRTARNFVRDRLRYVDAAMRPTAPWIAGGVATLLGALVALFVPFVGALAAISFGAAVAAGVAAGARDVRTGHYLVTDGK
jgi:hypothetical protein